ncbi:MAG: hypothetical protein ACEPOW_01200 [Bacteroidales bacterium]
MITLSCIKEKEIPRGTLPSDQVLLSYVVKNDSNILRKAIYINHTIYPERNQDTSRQVFTQENIVGTSKSPYKITRHPIYPGTKNSSLGMDLFCYFYNQEGKLTDSAHYQTKGFLKTPNNNTSPLEFFYDKVNKDLFDIIPWNAPLLGNYKIPTKDPDKKK